MKEAENRCTVWEDVSEKTFARFGQYVYTGDYEGESAFEPPAPKPEQEPEPERQKSNPAPAEPSSVDVPVSVPVNDDDFWASFPTKASKKKKRADPVPEEIDAIVAALTKQNAWKRFKMDRFYDCGVAGFFYVPMNENSLTEYEEVFISHARVHVMADYYNVQPLAQLALHKLHRILCGFTLHDERICDVISLLRFCFDEDERTLLRELVSAYAACHFKQLWTNLDFQELVVSRRELVLAILSHLVQRLD